MQQLKKELKAKGFPVETLKTEKQVRDTVHLYNQPIQTLKEVQSIFKSKIKQSSSRSKDKNQVIDSIMTTARRIKNMKKLLKEHGTDITGMEPLEIKKSFLKLERQLDKRRQYISYLDKKLTLEEKERYNLETLAYKKLQPLYYRIKSKFMAIEREKKQQQQLQRLAAHMQQQAWRKGISGKVDDWTKMGATDLGDLSSLLEQK